MKEKIIEGNKLIAEFMGVMKWIKPSQKAKILSGGKYKGTYTMTESGIKIAKNVNELKYHSSWDWLMDVVEKIEVTQKYEYYAFSVRTENKYCLIMGQENGRQGGVIYQTPYGIAPESKILEVWKGVIAFIGFYNDRNKYFRELFNVKGSESK